MKKIRIYTDGNNNIKFTEVKLDNSALSVARKKQKTAKYDRKMWIVDGMQRCN